MLEWQARIMQIIPQGFNQRTAYEMVTGRTPDISEYCDFNFYDLVWYWPNTVEPQNDINRCLARWVGVAHRVGSTMCYWLIPVSGIVIANTSVQHVIADDYLQPAIKLQIDRFDAALTERLDDANFMLDPSDFNPIDTYDDYNDNIIAPDKFDDDASLFGEWSEETQDIDNLDEARLDKFIGTTFILDPDHSPYKLATKVKVRDQSQDPSGRPIGKSHDNPLLNTAEYICELEDGTLDKFLANTIAENVWSQCDFDGNEFLAYKEILDHRKDEHAIPRGDKDTKKNGKPVKTTAGWEILVLFSKGETQWLLLRTVKESNAVELAEYAVNNLIAKEPAFAWWVPSMLNKRDRIIKKVKAKYWRTTHKFGVRIPKSLEEAVHIDHENGNRLWQDAIEKEMRKAQISYTKIDGHTPEEVRANECDPLRGHKEIKCHIVFDVKMDFTRKARFVAGGHMTNAPTSITYLSVVLQESVKIAFLIAALNGLDIMSCDIGNTYLNAPCHEKIWFVAGPECGPLLAGIGLESDVLKLRN
jgi:hypothetical protein